MHEVVYPNDVRMCQFEATFCLAPELVERGTIVNHQVGKKFERDIALQFFVARKPDYSHSASPEDLDQRVTAKNFLSAGKLTRSRVCDVTRALVSHLAILFMLKMERKIKAAVEVEQVGMVRFTRCKATGTPGVSIRYDFCVVLDSTVFSSIGGRCRPYVSEAEPQLVRSKAEPRHKDLNPSVFLTCVFVTSQSNALDKKKQSRNPA